MSSKRGRKRNDNLPPNRARDVQRAFRARRAAHLLALEQRVSELEAENARLRKIVGWPPDDRPPLGKGPTGKDKPKSFDATVPNLLDLFSNRDSESSAADSSSTRTSSLSPSAIASASSRPMQVISSAEPWDGALMMPDHNSEVASSSESPYHITSMTTPMVAPVPSKAMQYGSYPSSLPSSSRNSLSSASGMYLASPASYSHSSDRTLGNSYSSTSFVMRGGGDMREDPPRSHYSYPQTSYHTHDPNMHSPPPPPATPVHSHNNSTQRPESSMSYTHRRAHTDSQGYTIGQGFPHLPNPTQLHQNIRQTDMHRVQVDNNDQHTFRVTYGPDGRINSMP
ncbi:hypothetical protein BDZ94DRAFT_1251146 [Collybia nuda]|uniref:BZIP domain-containing protein n=1 Tax=Collybia nuda TaxID=64659 RepID=A0A9P5YD88_9AGAR|nr:hypothetical protein BDZ94DRAFT_1251146 [Collybia nuda]